MSTSHAHRSRSSAAVRRHGGGLRRRLGFEVMEGRCLLSAATLQFTAFSAAGGQDSSQVNTAVPIGVQQIQSTAIVEGGFISIGGLQTQSGHSVPTVVAGAGGGFGLILDVLGADSLTVPRVNGVTNLLTDFNTVGRDFGLRPVVISPSGGGVIAEPAMNPLDSLGASQGRGEHEGGIVHIESILRGEEPFDSGRSANSQLVGDSPEASTAPSDSPGTGLRSIASPEQSDSAADAPLSSAASTQLAVRLDQSTADFLRPAKSDVIAGELARAMVFEMAGGEPAWVRPVETIETVKPEAPADGQESPPADASPLSSASGQQSALQATTGRIRLSGNLVEFTLSRDDWSELNIGGQSRIESPTTVCQEAAPASNMSAFHVADTAAAEVFDQIGRSERAPVRGSFEEDTRSGPLVTGSVIVLLMLERAVARYMSRNEKQVLTVVAGPPRR